MVDAERNVIRDYVEMSEKWRQDFQGLYSCDENTDSNDARYEQAKPKLVIREQYERSSVYNKPIAKFKYRS